uniref:Uncharacterized protein n=1 Tax=Podarcis muralis TaxID=64176 RepID=A0A670JVG8_PODMU
VAGPTHLIEYALAGRAAPHAQLEVLLLREGAHHVLGRPDGERELPPCLAHGNGGADVRGEDLHVLPGRALVDAQAFPSGFLAPVRGSVLESRRQVVDLRLVDFLVYALLHVLEYDAIDLLALACFRTARLAGAGTEQRELTLSRGFKPPTF